MNKYLRAVIFIVFVFFVRLIFINAEKYSFHTSLKNTDFEEAITKKKDREEVKISLTDNTRVNINSAPKDSLVILPGIGSKTADKIISYRLDKPFDKIEDLMKIKGIGKKKFSKLKKYIYIKLVHAKVDSLED